MGQLEKKTVKRVLATGGSEGHDAKAFGSFSRVRAAAQRTAPAAVAAGEGISLWLLFALFCGVVATFMARHSGIHRGRARLILICVGGAAIMLGLIGNVSIMSTASTTTVTQSTTPFKIYV